MLAEEDSSQRGDQLRWQRGEVANRELTRWHKQFSGQDDSQADE
ncbi:hypothetical protein [Streptomyces flavidovirens]